MLFFVRAISFGLCTCKNPGGVARFAATFVIIDVARQAEFAGARQMANSSGKKKTHLNGIEGEVGKEGVILYGSIVPPIFRIVKNIITFYVNGWE